MSNENRIAQTIAVIVDDNNGNGSRQNKSGMEVKAETRKKQNKMK